MHNYLCGGDPVCPSAEMLYELSLDFQACSRHPDNARRIPVPQSTDSYGKHKKAG